MKIKSIFLFQKLSFFFLVVLISPNICFSEPKTQPVNAEYTLVIEGYDWGCAVSKIILRMDSRVSSVTMKDYSVKVKRSSPCYAANAEHLSGEREVIYAYVSDAQGNRAAEDQYITLVLSVSPIRPLDSPMQYFRTEQCRGNNWIDYQVTVSNQSTNQVWDKAAGKIRPLVDQFDLSGSFKYTDKLSMAYASFTPKNTQGKVPLIIWLHGGGEGGTDPSIVLLANRAANYASEEIQAYFGGAYVLAPQCPGAWMHNAEGVMTHGKENDIYNEGLMALIKNFVSAHPRIDPDRIYVGGCSNGGYMSLKLLLLHPNYFAAAYISALAYQSQYLSDAQIKSISHIPIWFAHSADDKTTLPDQTVLPVYERLKTAGAKDVHLSYYEHVTDITGFFGGENFYYNGHFSWVYCHANQCTKDFDGSPVKLNGRPVSIMEWMAAKKK